MSDRDDLIGEFLARTDHDGWDRQALPADASRRRYHRLSAGTVTKILMDAPPGTGENVRPFLRMSAHLSSLGLAAPVVHDKDPEAGLLLLEDLGLRHAADHLADHPGDETEIYLAAAEVLAHLQAAPAPDRLGTFSPEIGAEMLAPFFQWYAPKADKARIQAAMQDAISTVCDTRRVLSLRDFHAENIIWRPDETGHRRLGLLDFQDAFLAPPAYDLASLLDDARRDVGEATAEAVLNRFARDTGRPLADIAAERAVLSVQRNTRILGIFAGLIRRDGKPRYAAFFPRVRAHIVARLEHPALAGLRPLLLPHVARAPIWK